MNKLREQVEALLYEFSHVRHAGDGDAENIITLIRTATLDEVEEAVLNAYINLGDVYTSKDMYDDSMEAINKLRGD